MKKLIALVLSVVMICCFSVTAFAADSPTATEKVTVVVKKAEASNTKGEQLSSSQTVDKSSIITVKADTKYGKVFDGWSVYKSGTAVEAVAGVDYEIVGGTLGSNEITIKLNASVVVCANYDNVKTDPSISTGTDGSASAPQTGDMSVAYLVVVMLAVVAFGFGVKKVYSK